MRTNHPALRVCYFGTYRAGYARNAIIVSGLRRQGVEVIECQETLWQSFEDRERVASGGWFTPAFLWRLIVTYGRLLYRYARIGGRYDVMVVGYPGQFDVHLARLLTWLQGKPLAWDILMSIYLICLERGLDRRSPVTTAIIHAAESLACRLPDLLILDTQAYVGWFCRTYGIDPARFRRVPLTADERVFAPPPGPPRRGGGRPCRVLYHGTFIPNHGVPFIVEAARMLAGQPDIVFELVGDGPERALCEDLARRHGLRNLEFSGWLEHAALAERIAAADICLGAFGSSPQSLMTVQNKIYEAVAMGRPVITGDSPAVREVFANGEHLLLCDRSSPRALADLILRLRDDPELGARLAARARCHFVETCGMERVSQRFAAHLRELVDRFAARGSWL